MRKIILLVFTGLFLTAGCIDNSNETKVTDMHDSIEHDEDHEHDHSVEVEGREMRQMKIQQIADLWQIDAEKLLDGIIEEFDFKGNYTTETVLEDMRSEYKFSPAIIKDIAEEIKTGAEN